MSFLDTIVAFFRNLAGRREKGKPGRKPATKLSPTGETLYQCRVCGQWFNARDLVHHEDPVQEERMEIRYADGSTQYRKFGGKIGYRKKEEK